MQNLTKDTVQKLQQEILNTIADLGLDKKQSRLGELKNLSLKEDFWSNPDSAKQITTEIDHLSREIEKADLLKQKAKGLVDLYEMSSEKERESLAEDADSLQKEIDTFQTLKFLSGKYDQSDAILSIHSGQGGTEANDWTEMLQRMYTRYAEKNGWKTQIENLVPGTDAGISTVTIAISGRYAYGMLKKESGVHRLVRLSPFNSQNLRQTSFAGVEVIPVIDEDDSEIQIPDTDIEFKAVRSSGAGGQSVNKTSSAVQIKHIPTGITVHNSEQRSQAQNREAAMKRLRAQLWQLKQEKHAKELSDLKGDHKIAGWGNQIRNYVLHPYKLVKDLRTKIESSHPESILDGNLQEFIDAEIRLTQK